MCKLSRYSLIDKKMKREFLLLQGTGCAWKRCKFCDYYLDTSDDPFKVNKPVIEKITGKYGVVDIINSGSCVEIDEDSLNLIKDKIENLKIHTLWFESHWMYRNKLSDFAKRFRNCSVKFRVGIETFDSDIRDSWDKGIPKDVSVDEITKFFSGCCLLVGVKGQTRNSVLKDIETAEKYFEYFSVNVLVENSTNIERDEELVDWFSKYVFPDIKDMPKVDVLLNNRDLGVG